MLVVNTAGPKSFKGNILPEKYNLLYLMIKGSLAFLI